MLYYLYFSLFLFEFASSLFDDTGIIAYFATPCPQGWESYSLANGRFILSSGNYNAITYILNSMGGEDKVQLKQENMASHTHGNGEFKNLIRSNGAFTSADWYDSYPGEPDIYHSAPMLTIGNDVPHNNMPQYLVLSLCKKNTKQFCFNGDSKYSE